MDAENDHTVFLHAVFLPFLPERSRASKTELGGSFDRGVVKNLPRLNINSGFKERKPIALILHLLKYCHNVLSVY